MKKCMKTKVKIMLVVSVLALSVSQGAIAQMYSVIEAPALEALATMMEWRQAIMESEVYGEWLSVIDDLYATYDLVNSNLQQIENQVNIINNMVQQASTLPTSAKKIWGSMQDDWQEIDWQNFDFEEAKDLWNALDVRDEIQDLGKWADKQLDIARNVDALMTNPCISTGYGSYSVADLVGVTDTTTAGGYQANLASIFTEAGHYMKNTNINMVAADFDKSLSDEEKRVLRKYYKCSAAELFTSRAVESNFRQQVAAAINNEINATEKYMYEIGEVMKWEADLYSFLQGNNKDIPIGSCVQTIAHQMGGLANVLVNLQKSIDQGTALAATDMNNKAAKEELEKKQSEKTAKLKEQAENVLPGSMLLKGKPNSYEPGAKASRQLE